MLLRYLDLAYQDPVAFAMLLGAFIFSMVIGLSFHEFSHAATARALGDRTAERAGRLTLNPRAHLDPMGSLMILFAGFGWAKPTPVNVMATGRPRLALVLVSLAGPASNLVIAGIASALLTTGAIDFLPRADAVVFFLETVIQLNVLLAVFNFLPLAPLDGSKAVQGLLPPDLGREFARLEVWGPGVLLMLIALPWLTRGAFDPLSAVMGPPVRFLLGTFLGGGGI
ncbi:MAG: site-2 protease family protein [Dehalococcoidia bacterium]